MNKIQTAKFSSYNRLVAFLFDYASTFVGLKRLLLSATQFNTAFAALKRLLPTSTAITSHSITVTKNKDFSNMIDHIISLSKRAYLFAADTDNETLLSTFQVEKSDFHSLSEPEKIILAQNILLSLNSNNVDLIADYDITALELTTVSTAITTAQNEIAAPSTIIGNNKTSNVDIEAAYILVDEKVALLEKSILGRFLTGPFANLSLTANFELAKKLVESTRHTALLATITNTLGAVMEGVLVEINFITENREATSNISGIANVEQFEGGTYYVTYSAIGFITQVIATKFTLGKTTSTSIVLIKTI